MNSLMKYQMNLKIKMEFNIMIINEVGLQTLFCKHLNS